MEVHVSDLSNSLPVDVAPKKLSAFTEEVLRQRKSTDRGKDQYKLVKKNVYFYEFAKSVACSKVNLPNVIVPKLALDDLLGFDRSKLECDIEPYSPCMMVVPLKEHQQEHQQYHQQYQQQIQQYQQQIQQKVSQIQILLERKYMSDALDVCKMLSSSEPIATAPIAAIRIIYYTHCY